MRVRGLEMLVFRKILRKYLMDDPLRDITNTVLLNSVIGYITSKHFDNSLNLQSTTPITLEDLHFKPQTFFITTEV